MVNSGVKFSLGGSSVARNLECGATPMNQILLAGTNSQKVAEAARQVDKADFQTLIERHYAFVLRAALALAGRACEADDLAQETFLQALRSWQRFDGRSSPRTWLYAILLRVHRKRLRAATRAWRRWLTWFERRHAHAVNHDPDRQILADEWKTSLWSAVAQLPEAQQHALVLRYSEELSYEEIAEVLACPVGTVKSRIHHGLEGLKRRLGDIEPPETAALSRQSGGSEP